jgi:hypothetical protein
MESVPDTLSPRELLEVSSHWQIGSAHIDRHFRTPTGPFLQRMELLEFTYNIDFSDSKPEIGILKFKGPVVIHQSDFGPVLYTSGY